LIQGTHWIRRGWTTCGGEDCCKTAKSRASFDRAAFFAGLAWYFRMQW
jgi:hypothetical protein